MRMIMTVTPTVQKMSVKAPLTTHSTADTAAHAHHKCLTDTGSPTNGMATLSSLFGCCFCNHANEPAIAPNANKKPQCVSLQRCRL